MNVLVFAEQRETRFKKSSFEAVSTARSLADQSGGSCTALVIGSGIAATASELGNYGAAKVIAVDSPRYARHANSAWAEIIAAVARSIGAQAVVLSATQMGKDIAPRVAVALEAGLATDCTALTVHQGEILASRPVYAGKAVIDVKVTTPVKVFTLRPNVFSVTTHNGVVTFTSMTAFPA